MKTVRLVQKMTVLVPETLEEGRELARMLQVDNHELTHTLSSVLTGRQAMFENLTTTQERCTELIQKTRSDAKLIEQLEARLAIVKQRRIEVSKLIASADPESINQDLREKLWALVSETV